MYDYDYDYMFAYDTYMKVVGRADGGQGYAAMQQIMARAPGGGTPLCRQIGEVVARIQELEPQLRANCHKAVVVIATVCPELGH